MIRIQSPAVHSIILFVLACILLDLMYGLVWCAGMLDNNNVTTISTASFLPWSNIPVQLLLPEADVGPEPHTALTSWASLLEPYMMPGPTASQVIVAALLIGLAFCAGYKWRRSTSSVNSPTQREKIASTIREQTRPPVREELRRDLADEVIRNLKERERDGVIENLRNQKMLVGSFDVKNDGE